LRKGRIVLRGSVKHQPKLCKASAEHVLSCFSGSRTCTMERETSLELFVG
jgi:hypothetical protein